MRDAFLTTTYGWPLERVRLSGAPLLTERGVYRPSWAPPGTTWGIITAYNPGARHQFPAQNDRDDEALRHRLEALGVQHHRTVNGEGEWTEPSWLLTGVSVRELLELGVAFSQVAVVWGCGARAGLVWTGVPAAQGGHAAPEEQRVERRWVVPV